MFIDFNIGLPEGLMIVWCLLGLAISSVEDGNDTKVRFSVVLVRWLMFGALLVWGGFFS